MSAPTNETAPTTETAPESAVEDQPTKRWAWVQKFSDVLTGSPESDPIRSFSAFGVAISTAVISYETLHNLAQGMGFSTPAKQLFPIGIDLAVLQFTRAWLNRRLATKTRDFAKKAALFFITASVIGNAIWHIVDFVRDRGGIVKLVNDFDWKTSLPALGWLAVIVTFSALMPLALGLSLHQVAQISSDRAKGREERERETVEPVARRKKNGSAPSTKAASKQSTTTKPPAEPEVRNPRADESPTEVFEAVTDPETAADVDGDADLPVDISLVRQYGEKAAKAIQIWRSNLAARNGQGLSFREVDRRIGSTGYADKVIKQYIADHGDPREQVTGDPAVSSG
ncbi:DUF2637 domain-containing protein [Saccharothrix hoggarensis]|uniref:DUF2637 domain-containing protein n=1 Tax=Saccharothrix hoggarensis TaxID=913853 RepID=A0ABW3QGB7_9PSEU